MDLNSLAGKLNELVKNVLTKKNIFLAVIVVFGFVIAGIVMFGSFSSKITNLKNDNKNKLQKIDKITELNAAKAKLKKFLTSLSKPLTGEEMVTKVGDYAAENHINVLNIYSTDMQKHDVSSSMTINLRVRANDFKQLVAFLHEIEMTPLFKIETLSGRAGDSRGFVDCDMSLTAIQFNL